MIGFILIFSLKSSFSSIFIKILNALTIHTIFNAKREIM
jgi:hypothetical protein